MSENRDLVRSFYAGVHAFNAFMRGELSAEAYADEVDPQIELLWRDRQTYPDFPQHLQGLSEFLAFCEQYREGWIDMVQKPLEVADAPDGRILALVRQSGRGRQSGVPIVIHFFALYTIREGKMRKVEYFRHRADALQAAGLEDDAMSPENVEIVRTGCEAWLRGDFDAMSETWHPEVEWDTTHFEGWVENKVYRGQDEVRRFLEEWLASWDRESYQASFELLDKEEQVVVFWSQRMSGRGSGAPVKLDSAQVLTLRDGKVSRIDNYTDPNEALEAAGLAR